MKFKQPWDASTKTTIGCELRFVTSLQVTEGPRPVVAGSPVAASRHGHREDPAPVAYHVRFARKKSLSRAPHSSARTPAVTSTR